MGCGGIVVCGIELVVCVGFCMSGECFVVYVVVCFGMVYLDCYVCGWCGVEMVVVG